MPELRKLVPAYVYCPSQRLGQAGRPRTTPQSSRRTTMRQHGFWLGLTMMLALRTTAPAADFAWMEGEEPSSSNYQKYDVTSWAGHPYLSEGKWLRIQVPAGDAAKVVPNEGIVLGYDFLAPSAGKYEVWNRIGYEFVRSPFSWRIDNGPWQEVQPSNLTIDLMLLTDWNELAWCKCGLADLSQGKHRLEIRLQRWFKTANNSKEEQQIFYCSDALCISQGPFRPNGKFKPGAAYQDERDKAAAKQVFQMGRVGRPAQQGGRGRGPARTRDPCRTGEDPCRSERRQARGPRGNAAVRPVADRPLGRTDREGRRPHAAYRRRARRRTVILVRHRGARRSEREAAGNGLLPSLRLPHAGRRAGRPQWPGVLPALRRDEPDRVGDRQRPVLRSQCRAVYDLGLRRHQGRSTGQDQRNPGRREGRLLRRHQSARPVQPAHGFLPIPGRQQSLRFCRLEPHAERDRRAGVAGGRRQRVYVRRLCHSLAQETAAWPGDHAAQRFRRRRDRHHRQPVRAAGGRPGRKALRGPAGCHSGGPGQGRQARRRLGESQALVARCAAAIRGRHHDQARRPRDRHPPTKFGFREWTLGPRPVHAQRRAVPRPCRLLRRGHARGNPRPMEETRPEHDAVLGHELEGNGPGPGPGLLRPQRRHRPPHGTFRRRGRQLRPGGNRQGERQGRDPSPQGPLRQLGQSAQGRGPGERNHPSIMVWSIENEITFINSRNWGLAQWVEPAIRDVAKRSHGDGPHAARR